jgi:hypothetical protein
VDLAVPLDGLGRQLVARLVGVDRLVLRGVVLEDAPQVGQERDQREVDHEQQDADRAFDDHERAGGVDRQPVRDQRRRHLEERDRKADRDREGEDQLPA